MTLLWQVVVLAVVAAALSQAGSTQPQPALSKPGSTQPQPVLSKPALSKPDRPIDVECGEDFIQVTWRIAPEMLQTAARHFLGSCTPSTFSVLPSGEGLLVFNYDLGDCRFRTRISGKKMIYKNHMLYRPFAKPSPAEFTYPIECTYKREGWIPPFLNPGSGSVEGHGGLVFHLELLNGKCVGFWIDVNKGRSFRTAPDLLLDTIEERRTGLAKTNIFSLGSTMHIWAAVQQGSHQPLLLLLDECVAATDPELQPDTQVHPIITNKGCLVDGNSRFLPRYHSSAMLLDLQTFKFGLGEEVYIHCKLVAWDPEVLNEGKKACHYIKEMDGWELLDKPSQSHLCSCCNSRCRHRTKRGVDSEPQGLVKNSVLGPLTILDTSETLNHNEP